MSGDLYLYQYHYWYSYCTRYTYLRRATAKENQRRLANEKTVKSIPDNTQFRRALILAHDRVR